MIQPITIVKSANLSEVIVGDIIEYKIVVTNTTGVDLNEVIVKDLLTPDLNFVDGSVKIDGMGVLGSIITGINLEGMLTTKVKEITFEALVIGKSGVTIDNESTVVFKYTEGIVEKTEDEISNTVTIFVEIAELKISKLASVEEAQLNDIIEYRITVENIGTIELLNIIIKDTLSEAVELVEGSVKLNNVVINTEFTEVGINIGSLLPTEVAFLDYQVKVVAGTCSGYIENEACAIYNYRMENDGTGIKETECVFNKICVVISSFKQTGLSKLITLPMAKPNIEEIDDVVVEINVDNSYVVETMRSDSNEGQMLSGYKLVIHGKLKMSIEYTALLPTQPMHSAHCEVPFSSFLILPPDYIKGSYVEVSTELENMDVDLINLRSAMVNIIFLIIAKIN